MPTSVVTGGAGFLGSHLCERLICEGHFVICIDNLDTGSLQNIEHIRGAAFDFRNHDCVDFIDVPEPVDYVFHLASPASPIDYLRLPLHTLKVGSFGTHNAIGLAKFKRARFLLTSTSEVYGDPMVHPQPESYWGNVNPIGPRGVYDESKRYAEAMVMAYHRQQGVDTCIARVFNTYGPRMRPNDGRAVPTFMRQAMAGKPLTVFGDGSQTRSFCYVDDLVDGLWRLASSGEHTPVNLGNPAEITVLELAREIIAVTGSTSEIVFSALPMDDPKIRRPDVSKAKRLLEWRPRIGLHEGLERLCAYEHHWVSHSMTGLEYEKPAVETLPADAATDLLGDQGPAAATTDLLGDQGPAAATDLLGDQGPAAAADLLGDQGPAAAADLLGDQGPAAA